MSFASPLALLALLLVPAAVAGYVWFQRRRVRESARFVEPALLPNIVDRVPGWRRHLPVALLLLAVTAFLVGFARPHATISVRSEEATAILAIDTLAVDGCDRRRADEARGRPGLGPPVPRRPAGAVPRRRRRLQLDGAGRLAADA